MAPRFLLDTNVVSELTKPQPNPGVLQALAQYEADCAISAPTLEELVFGCHRLPAGARRDWLLRWVRGLPARLPVLSFDEPAALWLGVERAQFKRCSPIIAESAPARRVLSQILAIGREIKDLP